MKDETPVRRPTGHSLYVNGDTIDSDEVKGNSTEISTASSNEPDAEQVTRERKKSVAFNDNVQKMELDVEELSTDL